MILETLRTSSLKMKEHRGPPEELLARVESLLHDLRVTPPFDISFTDSLGIPVHLTVRTPALEHVSFDTLKEWGEFRLSYTHQGTGLTSVQSRLSCLMEAIERFSAGHHPLEGRLITAPCRELEPEAVDPRIFYLPPGTDFSCHRPLVWYRGVDILSNEPVCVPVDLVLIDLPDSAYPFDGFETHRLGFFFSNGLAAGATRSEALIAAILEVIERDSQHRLDIGTAPQPVELALKDDHLLGPWVELFHCHRLSLRAFFTCRIPGIYSAVATSWDEYCRILVMGTAADTDIRAAVHRAIMELIQQRAYMFFKTWKTRRQYLPIVRYIRDRIPPSSYATHPPASFWTEQAFTPIALDDAGARCPRDLGHLLSAICRDHRIIAFDLTHPDLGIPVVRVLIEGMQNGYLHYQQALAFVEEQPS